MMNVLYGSQIALIFLFLFVVILFVLPQRVNNSNLHDKLLIFFGSALFLIAVTRPDTTADTNNYIYDFKTGNAATRLEPMYFIIIRIARIFSNPVLIGFSIYALLSVMPRFYFIKLYSANVWASIMVYMSYCYMAQDIIAMRSAVASALVLFIIHFKNTNRIIHIIITIFIASLFHYSALIFTLLLFITPDKKHMLLYIGLLFGSYLLYFIGFDIRVLFPMMTYFSFMEYNIVDYYNSTAEVYGTLNGPQILRLSTCLFFWLFIDNIMKKYSNALIYLKVYTISLCMFPVFSSIATMGYRMYELFASAESIGLPLLFFGVFNSNRLSKIAIIIYTFYFFYVSINNIAYWDPVIN